MNWASRISEDPSLEKAIQECAQGVIQDLAGATPDLAILFVSAEYTAEYDWLPRLVNQNLGPVRLFGCSGGGVIGGGREVENRPGLSLTVAHMPGVEVDCFHLEGSDLPDMDASPDAWHEALHIPADKDPHFLILADPFTFPASNLIVGLDYAYPRSVKVGGLASGGQSQGGNALYLEDQMYMSGAVGLALHGNIAVDTVVAQGCRPIGRPMHITNCHDNILLTLDGDSPMKVLQELFESLDERDQGLMRYSLFLGVVMDELHEDPQQGDFLIRNLIGTDPQSGAVAIGEMLREGQLVQFHLRDALTSRDDLAAVLDRYIADHEGRPPQGALLFSCQGRGQHLYGRPDHDTNLLCQKVGPIPLGGFFCNGEIGQVGGTTFLHGYTSSLGLFRPAQV